MSVTCLYSIFKMLGHYLSPLGCVENMAKVEGIAIKCNPVWLYKDICNFIFLCSLLVKKH